MPEPMSLSAYARHRGVSVEAVSKAVTRGRLRVSLVMVDGKPKIADPTIADSEWDANTRPRVDRPPARKKKRRQRAKPTKKSAPVPVPGPSIATSEIIPDYNVSRAIRESHAARREGALADMAEIERDKLREDVVPVDEARAYIIDKFTVVKTRLLGVPSRVAQQLPHLASEVEPVIDRLLREVLEELAAEDDDGDGEEEKAG